MLKTQLAIYVAIIIIMPSSLVLAESDVDIQTIKSEIQTMKEIYEARINELEAKLEKVEKTQEQGISVGRKESLASSGRKIFGNEFNPSIGVVLNGKYSDFSEDSSEIAGFGVGEEGERGSEGLAIGESELNVSANVDDKFYGSLTAAIVHEEGEDKVELEEAYIQTLPNAGLAQGLSIKMGRAFWTLGYMNEHHAHADDFADRPLPYRAFLNKAFNDDGAEMSYILPTDFYSEIGVGVFRADDFPFGGGDGEGIDAWSGFVRIGGDIGTNKSWRLGGYVLSGEAENDGRGSNEDEVTFIGDVDLHVADLRYVWAPTGNAREKEVILQGEYFRRKENGTYEQEDVTEGAIDFDDTSTGLYVQAVYKFNPRWRIGARYSRLKAPDVPEGLEDSALDSSNHNPEAYAAMLDWTKNSEFSRIRFQFNNEKLNNGNNDDQIILQYIMSLGAHGAHKY